MIANGRKGRKTIFFIFNKNSPLTKKILQLTVKQDIFVQFCSIKLFKKLKKAKRKFLQLIFFRRQIGLRISDKSSFTEQISELINHRDFPRSLLNRIRSKIRSK